MACQTVSAHRLSARLGGMDRHGSMAAWQHDQDGSIVHSEAWPAWHCIARHVWPGSGLRAGSGPSLMGRSRRSAGGLATCQTALRVHWSRCPCHILCRQLCPSRTDIRPSPPAGWPPRTWSPSLHPVLHPVLHSPTGGFLHWLKVTGSCSPLSGLHPPAVTALSSPVTREPARTIPRSQ
jgi:hypothetical protein